jgi:hypothetical protein
MRKLRLSRAAAAHRRAATRLEGARGHAPTSNGERDPGSRRSAGRVDRADGRPRRTPRWPPKPAAGRRRNRAGQWIRLGHRVASRAASWSKSVTGAIGKPGVTAPPTIGAASANHAVGNRARVNPTRGRLTSGARFRVSWPSRTARARTSDRTRWILRTVAGERCEHRCVTQPRTWPVRDIRKLRPAPAWHHA